MRFSLNDMVVLDPPKGPNPTTRALEFQNLSTCRGVHGHYNYAFSFLYKMCCSREDVLGDPGGVKVITLTIHIPLAINMILLKKSGS